MILKKKILLTVGREYGSGGRVISEALGRDLGIPVFDKNMLSMIAKKHGYDEKALAASDEKLTTPFFESYFPYGTDSGGIAERLFLLQASIIKEEADKGSGIFIGRCANDVLREYDNVINIFIFAPKADRIKRIMEVDQISDPAQAEKMIKRMDKTRRSYYQFYTDKRWGTTDDMDLMINSSALGIEGSVTLIEDFLYRGGYAV